MLAGRYVRQRPEWKTNNQLEWLPMPGFLRKIPVIDENEPHLVLEKLHEKWANATEDTEAAWERYGTTTSKNSSSQSKRAKIFWSTSAKQACDYSHK